jgi:hypothetical protein
LACADRLILTPADVRLDDKLYRGFRSEELDDEGKLDADTLRLPDLSCNWNRFSIPHDIRYRMPGCEQDGCYAITVETARYKSFATPCHDPMCGAELAFQLRQSLNQSGEEIASSEFGSELRTRVESDRRGEIASSSLEETGAIFEWR